LQHIAQSCSFFDGYQLATQVIAGCYLCLALFVILINVCGSNSACRLLDALAVTVIYIRRGRSIFINPNQPVFGVPA
jgi:hypothetical protein